MPNDDGRVQINCRVTPELYERLRQRAFKMHVSQNVIQVKAIEMFLDAKDAQEGRTI